MRRFIPYALTLIVLFLTGCMGPNCLDLSKRAISASGDIYWHQDKIGHIYISPQDLPEFQKDDLWIGFSPTNRIAFSAVTEELVKATAIPATSYYTNGVPGDYYLDGYLFRFKDGKFVWFMASRYGSPNRETTTYSRIGSLKSGCDVGLPCSLDDFEHVFGKPDSIKRYFRW